MQDSPDSAQADPDKQTATSAIQQTPKPSLLICSLPLYASIDRQSVTESILHIQQRGEESDV
jgi:hypothetical protein